MEEYLPLDEQMMNPLVLDPAPPTSTSLILAPATSVAVPATIKLPSLPNEMLIHILRFLLCPWPSVIRFCQNKRWSNCFTGGYLNPSILGVNKQFLDIGRHVLYSLNRFEFTRTSTMLAFMKMLHEPTSRLESTALPSVFSYLTQLQLSQRRRQPYRPDWNKDLSQQAFRYLGRSPYLKSLIVDLAALPVLYRGKEVEPARTFVTACAPLLRARWNQFVLEYPDSTNQQVFQNLISMFKFVGGGRQYLKRTESDYMRGGLPLGEAEKERFKTSLIGQMICVIERHVKYEVIVDDLKNGKELGVYNVTFQDRLEDKLVDGPYDNSAHWATRFIVHGTRVNLPSIHPLHSLLSPEVSEPASAQIDWNFDLEDSETTQENSAPTPEQLTPTLEISMPSPELLTPTSEDLSTFEFPPSIDAAPPPAYALMTSTHGVPNLPQDIYTSIHGLQASTHEFCNSTLTQRYALQPTNGSSKRTFAQMMDDPELVNDVFNRIAASAQDTAACSLRSMSLATSYFDDEHASDPPSTLDAVFNHQDMPADMYQPPLPVYPIPNSVPPITDDNAGYYGQSERLISMSAQEMISPQSHDVYDSPYLFDTSSSSLSFDFPASPLSPSSPPHTPYVSINWLGNRSSDLREVRHYPLPQPGVFEDSPFWTTPCRGADKHQIQECNHTSCYAFNLQKQNETHGFVFDLQSQIIR